MPLALEMEEKQKTRKKVLCLCSQCSLFCITFQSPCSESCRMTLLLKTGFVLGFFRYLERAFQWRRKQLLLPLRVSRMELIGDSGYCRNLLNGMYPSFYILCRNEKMRKKSRCQTIVIWTQEIDFKEWLAFFHMDEGDFFLFSFLVSIKIWVHL